TLEKKNISMSSTDPSSHPKGKAAKSYLGIALVIGGLLFLSTDCKQSSGPTSHDEAFSNGKLLTVSASDLKNTVVAATINAPLKQGKNVVWCGTFQMAWNEACTLVGEDLHFDSDPPIVTELNKKAFRKDDLDTASYVTLAGFVKDGIHQKISRALQEKFGGTAQPHSIPSESLTPRPQDIVAYSLPVQES
ncbi:MAG: hypothetical protein ABSC01_08035, partial [Verrucomicrobiota bacterium]